ncbi:hypothetical protein [Vibrio sp. THAF190c]|jgi:hypothetical protein|uniref:hypothetical protein n=1 Tax=Vibrio sp. THAF190c TaxID=2587865 RepID=UPI001267B2D0|nr:hypothetical protein [Vibrio sp. THAF190c]QFT13429.1 hypothetical protein FIV04_26100 [Vibrio sp. THAF190c]
MGAGTKFINEIVNSLPELPDGFNELSDSYKAKCIYYVRRLKKTIPHIIEQPFSSFTELEKFVQEADKNGFSQFMSSDFTKSGVTFTNHTRRLKGLSKYLSAHEVSNGIIHLDLDLTKHTKTNFSVELSKLISALNFAGISSVEQFAMVLSEDNRRALHELSKYFDNTNFYFEFLKLVALVLLKNTTCDEGEIGQIKDDFDVDPELALSALYPIVNDALALSVKELKYL